MAGAGADAGRWEALRGACGIERLDLSFNHLTDAGVHVLLKALASGAGLELSRVHLGGNRLVSGGGMAKSVWLTQLRADLDPPAPLGCERHRSKNLGLEPR